MTKHEAEEEIERRIAFVLAVDWKELTLIIDGVQRTIKVDWDEEPEN